MRRSGQTEWHIMKVFEFSQISLTVRYVPGERRTNRGLHLKLCGIALKLYWTVLPFFKPVFRILVRQKSIRDIPGQARAQPSVPPDGL